MTTNNIIEDLGPAISGWWEPVTADELADHIRLNYAASADQSNLERFIVAAREHFEFSTDGRVVLSSQFAQHLTGWPTDRYAQPVPIQLHRGRVTSLDSITYYDADDVQQTADLGDWSIDTTGIPALVYRPDKTYPVLSTTRPRPVTIEFTAGWESVGEVPEDVKLGVLMLAGEWYQTREAYQDADRREVPMGFQRLANRYKTGLGGL